MLYSCFRVKDAKFGVYSILSQAHIMYLLPILLLYHSVPFYPYYNVYHQIKTDPRTVGNFLALYIPKSDDLKPNFLHWVNSESVLVCSSHIFVAFG